MFWMYDSTRMIVAIARIQNEAKTPERALGFKDLVVRDFGRRI